MPDQPCLPDLKHRWRIAEPAGPTSLGTCRLCGATRLFKNWAEDFVMNTDWDETTHNPWRAGAFKSVEVGI